MAVMAEFKKFVASGNVVGLAVAVILGTAFGLVVASFTNDILMQLIAAIGAKPDFSGLEVSVRGTSIRYGAFLTTVINFLIVAFVMFLVARTYNRWTAKKEAAPAGPTEVELLKEIRDTLRARTPV